jgi:hypothetical protein
MKCSHCGFQTNDYALAAACPLCGACAAGTDPAGYPGKNRAAPPEGSSCSPDMPLTSYVQALYDSIVRPEVFFSRIGTREPSHRALVYGLVMGSIGTLLAVGISALLPWSVASLFGDSGLYGHADRAAPAVLILSPLILVMQYGIGAAYVQLMLKISGSRPKPLALTFQTLCYAGGARIFEWIPVIGPFLSLIAWIYLTITGLHVVHGISRARAAAALLLPLVVVSVLLALILIIVVAAITMVGGAQPDLLKFLHR